ncbi:MAG TPA: alpha/beta hydrolase [Actinomycetes bacterium]|nr:alpha/beta hydrolase [Actinomycetes bacterium]
MASRDPAVEALNALIPGGVVRGGARVDEGGGRTLRWVEAGRGRPGPTVVLDAGRNDTAISWAPLLVALAERARLVAYDRAGLGASDPDLGPEPPSVQRQVADLATVIRSAGHGPCVVVGHSWGGLLAQLLAARHPDLVCGLVLIDPAHLDMMAELPRPLGWLNRQVTGRLGPVLWATGLLRPWVWLRSRGTARQFSDDPRVRSLLVDAYRVHAGRTQVRANRDEFRAILADARSLRRALAEPRAGVPLVVLSATGGAPAGVRRHWTSLQAGIAAGRGRHVVVPDTGHNLHQDRPDLVAAAVLEVVEKGRRPGREAQISP